MPRGGDKEIARANAHPQSTLQRFSLITRLSSATLSILMCDFLFQLVSAFVPAPFYSNPRVMQNFTPMTRIDKAGKCATVAQEMGAAGVD